MTDPIVSILLPTFQRPESLAGCLRSIARTVSLAHEVVAIMVAGDEPTDAVLSDHPVRVVSQPARGGFVQAVNMGLAAARGEYVLQVNDDCELLPHSVANAVRFLRAPAHRGRIGQAAFYHNSPVKRNIQAQVQLDGEWFFVCHVRGLCYANFGLAARELWERLGGYDERYFMYGADPDFSLKVWHEARLEVAPCPGALIRHHQLDDERAAKERRCQDDDNRALFAKWGLDE